MRYVQLTAAERLLVDIINGREQQSRDLGDSRFGVNLQGRGLVVMRHENGGVVLTPTQLGRNWAAIRNLIETPQPQSRKTGADAQ